MWPGATTEDTLNQITERLERTLEETPHLDFLRSFTTAGAHHDLRQPQGQHVGAAGRRHLVSRPQEHRRYPAHAAVRRRWARSSTTSSATRSVSSTASPRTGSRSGSCATTSKTCARSLLSLPDVSKIEILGAQDERIFIEFSMRELASLGIDQRRIDRCAAGAEHRPAVRRNPDRERNRVGAGFPARSSSEQDIASVNFAIGGRMLRLSDIATHSPRLSSIRRSRSFESTARRRLALPSPCVTAATSSRSATIIKREMAKITAELPVGIEPILVADQAVTVEHAIADFMTSLWQAVAIILVVSFISLGMRPGLVIALAIPLTLAIVFSLMEIDRHRHAADLARRADHRARVAGRRRHDHDRRDAQPACARRRHVDAATFAFRTYAVAMLAGTLVTIAGFVPVGFAASSAGEYTFSLFAVVAIALIVSWFVAVIFAPLLGVLILKPPKSTAGEGAASSSAALPGTPHRRDTGQMAHHPAHTRPVRRVDLRGSADPQPVLPVFRPARAAGRSRLCRRMPRSTRARPLAERFDAVLKGDPDVAALEHLCRPRRDPLLPAARCAAAQRFLRSEPSSWPRTWRRASGSRSSSKRRSPRISEPSWRESIRWSSDRRLDGRCSIA